MEDRSKHIDDLFREGLGDYRETPPADVWASLEKRLPEPEDDGSSRKWIWLLLLLLLGTAGYLAYKSSSDTKHTATIGQSGGANKTPKANDYVTPAEPVTGTEAGEGSIADESTPDATGLNGAEANRNARDIAENDINHNATKGGRRKHESAASVNTNRRPGVGNSRSGKKNGSVDDNTSDSESHVTDANHKVDAVASSGINITPAKGGRVKPVAKPKDTEGNTISDKSSVVAKATASGSNNSIAGEPDNSRKVRSESADGKASTASKTKNTARQQADKDDNNYLRQPVPEDDEENVDEDGQKVSAGNKSRSVASPEDEVKKKLLYIPPDESLVPIAPSKTASNSKESGNKTDEHTTERKDRQDAKVASNVTGEESGKSNLNVTGAANSKKELVVQPATFPDQKKQPVKSAKFRKDSGMSVTSEVPTDPDEKINFKPQNEQGAQVVVQANNDKINLAGAKSSTAAEEETANPSTGGGGGGGGGATSPSQNGSKFRFDLGIKAGYERGFESFTTNTFIIAPYLQWNISTGFAFVFQPGFRYNQLSSNSISNVTNSYHRITSETVTPNHVVDSIQPGPPSIQRNYIYNSTYDSVVIGTRLKANSYWEIELPVLLRYKIASNLAVFGGLSLMFGNIINTEEVRTSYSGQHKTSTLSFPKDTNVAQEPTIPPATGYFSYNTPDISTAPAAAEAPSSNPARLGLMLGFSYEFGNRVSIDLMYKQTVSDMRYIQNEQIRKLYTQPNVRVMVGFKLFGAEKEKDVKKPEGF